VSIYQIEVVLLIITKAVTMRRHPSGRPIRRAVTKRLSIERPPREEYLTPSMNAKELPDRIGFVHHFASDDDWDDEEEIPDEV
jgi:hypothetical protein